GRDSSAARTTAGETADESTRTGASRSSLAGWRIARVQTERGEQNATNNCEKLFVHNDLFVSLLNAQVKRMLRSKNELFPAKMTTACGKVCSHPRPESTSRVPIRSEEHTSEL